MYFTCLELCICLPYFHWLKKKKLHFYLFQSQQLPIPITTRHVYLHRYLNTHKRIDIMHCANCAYNTMDMVTTSPCVTSLSSFTHMLLLCLQLVVLTTCVLLCTLYMDHKMLAVQGIVCVEHFLWYRKQSSRKHTIECGIVLRQAAAFWGRLLWTLESRFICAPTAQ